MFKVSDLKYRTQNDFGLAIVSTDNLGESSEKNPRGGVEFFYKALQACFLIDFSLGCGMSSNRGGFHPPMPVVAFPPAGDNCSAGPMRIHACHQCHRGGEHSCRPRLMARWRALLQAPLDGATPIRLFETTQVKCRPSGWLVLQSLKHASLHMPSCQRCN